MSYIFHLMNSVSILHPEEVQQYWHRGQYFFSLFLWCNILVPLSSGDIIHYEMLEKYTDRCL